MEQISSARIAPDSPLTTPTRNFTELSLNSPESDIVSSDQVSNIIQHLRLLETGREFFTCPWHAFPLSGEEFKHLIEILEADKELRGFFMKKVRYDYFSRSEEFVIRMNSRIHEVIIARIVSAIQAQLWEIAKGNDPAASHARKIDYDGSPILKFDAKTIDLEGNERSGIDFHRPDAAFCYRGAYWPQVVIEVSHSTKRKRLRELADTYLVRSAGNIALMIGIDIEYDKSEEAAISVWRPQYVVDDAGHKDLISVETISHQRFRDQFGNPVNDLGLQMQLKDFIPVSEKADRDSMTDRICISSPTLNDILWQAEERHRIFERGTGMIDPMRPGANLRQLSRTPPEEMRPKDERMFLKREEAVERRQEADDEDFIP